MLRHLLGRRTIATQMECRHHFQRFDFPKGPIGPSSITPVLLNNRYMEYVDRIFRWSTFRQNGLIQRKDIDDNLVEMRRLAECFGNPQNQLKVVHVAGTNGKGSVTMKVARTLQEMGYKTGMFTSPHINSFRERIQVNQDLISQQQVIDHCEQIFSAIEKQKLD